MSTTAGRRHVTSSVFVGFSALVATVGEIRAAPTPDAAVTAGTVQAKARVDTPLPVPAAVGRVFCIGQKTWIWPSPRVPRGLPREGTNHPFLGYIRTGMSVALATENIVPGENCPGGFSAILPRGYVCRDATVTFDAEHSFLRANAPANPSDGPFPYRFAISNGAPMYARIPTATEAKRMENIYGKAGDFLPKPLALRDHEGLATVQPIQAVDPMPEFVRLGVTASGQTPLATFLRTIPHGSMLSFTRAFDSGNRTWLLSADLSIVPADRVREFRRSAFAGISTELVTQLPLAWFRERPRPRYSRGANGSFQLNSRSWPERTWTPLTGRAETQGRRRFLEVRGDAGEWTEAADATVVERRLALPFLVKPGEKWILVSLTQGTLVAYEDLTPVYATLISPGRGGVPRPGGDLVQDSTTPLGAFRITWKDRAATMSPQTGGAAGSTRPRFWIADVPFTQYFSAPFALHASYWHETFGEPMSGGCINASPIDAEWLFRWSGPTVPDGWQGAAGAASPENGPATWVIVTP